VGIGGSGSFGVGRGRGGGLRAGTSGVASGSGEPRTKNHGRRRQRACVTGGARFGGGRKSVKEVRGRTFHSSPPPITVAPTGSPTVCSAPIHSPLPSPGPASGEHRHALVAVAASPAPAAPAPAPRPGAQRVQRGCKAPVAAQRPRRPRERARRPLHHRARRRPAVQLRAPPAAAAAAAAAGRRRSKVRGRDAAQPLQRAHPPREARRVAPARCARAALPAAGPRRFGPMCVQRLGNFVRQRALKRHQVCVDGRGRRGRAPARGTRRVRLVREEGRGVSH
jgi:hypothetical protein